VTPQALHQRRMKAEGRCVRCCRPKDTTTARCAFCAARNNAQVRSRRHQLIAQGRCTECREPAQDGYTRCFDCRVRHAEWDRQRRLRRAVRVQPHQAVA
jgi:hypothetical protein